MIKLIGGKIMKNLFSIKETAKELNLNYRTVLRLIDAGVIHSIRIGRTHRISKSEIDRFIHSADKKSVTYNLY